MLREAAGCEAASLRRGLFRLGRRGRCNCGSRRRVVNRFGRGGGLDGFGRRRVTRFFGRSDGLRLVVESALDLVFHTGGGLLEFADGFAQAACELRHFFSAEQQQNDKENKHHLAAADVEDR